MLGPILDSEVGILPPWEVVAIFLWAFRPFSQYTRRLVKS